MREDFALVRTKEEALHGIRSFQDALTCGDTLQHRLANFRAWYAYNDPARNWLFAPSKWIGYRDVNLEIYAEYSTKGMDGRQTEKQLQRWFRPLERNSSLYNDLFEKLKCFLLGHDKTPNALARVHLVHFD